MSLGALHCYECVSLYNCLIKTTCLREWHSCGFDSYIKITQKRVSESWGKTIRLLAQQPTLRYCPHCFGTRVAVVDQEFRNRFSDELLQVKFEPDGRVFTHELWKWSEEESRERLLELIEREEVTRAKLAKKANAPKP